MTSLSAARSIVGGPQLAGQAIAAGLADEYQLFVVPAVVGGGTRGLQGHVRMNLALPQEHRFASGVVYLCYRLRSRDSWNGDPASTAATPWAG